MVRYTVLEYTCREAGGEKGGRSPRCSGFEAGGMERVVEKEKKKKSGWVSVQILQEKKCWDLLFRG